MSDRPPLIIGGVDIREVASCSCLRLRKAARRTTQLYDSALAPTGLTITQFGVLANLYGALAQTGPGLPIGLLAERLCTDATTLNRNLKPLEAGGLIANGQDPDDRRIRIVAPTESRIVRLADATARWRQAQARLGTRVGPEATPALNGLLDLVVAKLDA